MYLLRSHSLIWIILLALLAGITAQSALNNFSDERADELTVWLVGFANDQQSELAYEKLRDINRSGSSHHDVIAKASHIMLENPDVFSLPENTAESNDDLVQVLLLQWTSQQGPSGMNSSAQIERSRNLYASTPDGQSRSLVDAAESVINRAVEVVRKALPAPSFILDRLLKPLLNGLAINAP